MRIRFPATCIVATFIDLVWPDAIARPTKLGHLLTFSSAGMLCPEYLSLTQVRWTEPVEFFLRSSSLQSSPQAFKFAGLAQFNSFCAHYVRYN